MCYLFSFALGMPFKGWGRKNTSEFGGKINCLYVCQCIWWNNIPLLVTRSLGQWEI